MRAIFPKSHQEQEIADLKERLDALEKKMDAYIEDSVRWFRKQDTLNAMIASRLEGLK
jgi:hypothetical protein